MYVRSKSLIAGYNTNNSLNNRLHTKLRKLTKYDVLRIKTIILMTSES